MIEKGGEEDVFGRETGIKYRRWMEKANAGSTKYRSHGRRGTGFYPRSAKTKSITD